MTDLRVIFTNLLAGVQQKDARYKVHKEYHVTDKDSNIEYKLYHDKPFELWYMDDVILTGRAMSGDEAELLESVRKTIIDFSRQHVYDLVNNA